MRLADRIPVALVAVASLAGCGKKSLLGVKNAYEVSMTADNKSDYPLQVTLTLKEGATHAACEATEKSENFVVPPQSAREESLRLKCEAPPRNIVRLELQTPSDHAAPIQWASLDLTTVKLKAAIAAGTEIRWHIDPATLRSGPVTSPVWVDTNGVRTPPDAPTTVAPPDPAALAAAPVRAAAKMVEVFFAPDASVSDIGLPATLFDGKPEGVTSEIDGFYYFAPHLQVYAGTLALERDISAAKITCVNASCSLSDP